MARKNNNRNSNRNTVRNRRTGIVHRAQSSKPFVPSLEPRSGTPFVMQTIRVQSNITATASTGATVTFAQFLGNINGFAGGSIKLLRLAVYGPTHAVDYVFTVTDLLPNSDGLVLQDSGTTGAARPSVGWVPTELDRITTHTSSGTVNMFSWTSNVAVTGQLAIVATVQLRSS